MKEEKCPKSINRGWMIRKLIEKFQTSQDGLKTARITLITASDAFPPRTSSKCYWPRIPWTAPIALSCPSRLPSRRDSDGRCSQSDPDLSEIDQQKSHHHQRQPPLHQALVAAQIEQVYHSCANGTVLWSPTQEAVIAQSFVCQVINSFPRCLTSKPNHQNENQSLY